MKLELLLRENFRLKRQFEEKERVVELLKVKKFEGMYKELGSVLNYVCNLVQIFRDSKHKSRFWAER